MATDLYKYWTTWQQLSTLSSKKYSVPFHDPVYGVTRNAPCWSPDIPNSKCPTQVDGTSLYNIKKKRPVEDLTFTDAKNIFTKYIKKNKTLFNKIIKEQLKTIKSLN